LLEVFKGFKKIPSSNQRKLIDCFHQKVFPQGSFLIREGVPGDEAYLIKEGECILRSKKNPLTLASITDNDKEEDKTVDTIFRPKRGFWSDTINCLQFSILDKNQWIGEERLLETFQPLEMVTEYSIVANTKVIAYSITRAEAEKKLPNELLKQLQKLAKTKGNWIKERTKALVKTSQEVDIIDPNKTKYDEKMNHVLKKYPQALPHAVSNIRKIQIQNKNVLSPKLSVQINSPKSLDLTYNLPTLTPLSKNYGIQSEKMPQFLKSTGKKPSIPLPKMSNATSASKLLLMNHLVPTLPNLNHTKSYSKLALISKASMFDNATIQKLLSKPTNSENKGSHFSIAIPQKLGKKTRKNSDEDRPPTSNPYMVLSLNIAEKIKNLQSKENSDYSSKVNVNNK